MRRPSFGEYGRPSAALLATELPRAVLELGATGTLLPLLRRAPRGDGHPVLVLPGFTAGDGSTGLLRWFLRDRGYGVAGWGLGRNLGPNCRVVQGLRRRVTELAERHGRPVSLVGWSLGGMYAREIARQAPGRVRSVVTLGSPFRLGGEPPPEADLPQPKVPVTAIYSRSDGVAPWRSCVDDRGAGRESIEVLGSHIGLGHNPAVLLILADRLAQPEGTWAPFRGNRLLNRAVALGRRS